MPGILCGESVVRQQRFAVLVSRTNEFITSRLRDAAIDTLSRHGCAESNITEVWVPGSFELPLAAKRLAARRSADGKGYDAIIVLGCVIRGATPHFESIATAVCRGLSQVALESDVPIAFGVLTTNNVEQAIERAGTKGGNKGHDAALSAIEMTSLLSRIDGQTTM